MGDFMIGLCIALLGFGFFQFSGMFNLYEAQKDDITPPWPFLIMRTVAYISMAIGAFMILKGILST